MLRGLHICTCKKYVFYQISFVEEICILQYFILMMSIVLMDVNCFDVDCGSSNLLLTKL
jgi:hypothetical protein